MITSACYLEANLLHTSRKLTPFAITLLQLLCASKKVNPHQSATSSLFLQTTRGGGTRRKPTIGIEQLPVCPCGGTLFLPRLPELRGEPRGACPACPEPRTERRLRRVEQHLGFLSSREERRRNCSSTNCFRINTCRSVSKQMTFNSLYNKHLCKNGEGRVGFPSFHNHPHCPGCGALRLCSLSFSVCRPCLLNGSRSKQRSARRRESTECAEPPHPGQCGWL